MNDYEKVAKNCAKKMFINISNEEIIAFAKKLEEMDNEFTLLEEKFPDIDKVKPLTHIIDLPNKIMREDNPIESTPIEELLKNSKHVNGREIEVPKVVE